MNIRFFTNVEVVRPFLDNLPPEWYHIFRQFPRKGDLIQIPTQSEHLHFELEVHNVIWSYEKQIPTIKFNLVIPTHYPNHQSLEHWNCFFRSRIERVMG